MSEATESKKAKFFNALTEFALVLLLPPKPLINTTISVDSYMDKLLGSDDQAIESQNEGKGLQNLLFCSIMAATDENAIHKILSKGKIEWLMGELKK